MLYWNRLRDFQRNSLKVHTSYRHMCVRVCMCVHVYKDTVHSTFIHPRQAVDNHRTLDILRAWADFIRPQIRQVSLRHFGYSRGDFGGLSTASEKTARSECFGQGQFFHRTVWLRLFAYLFCPYITTPFSHLTPFYLRWTCLALPPACFLLPPCLSPPGTCARVLNTWIALAVTLDGSGAKAHLPKKQLFAFFCCCFPFLFSQIDM